MSSMFSQHIAPVNANFKKRLSAASPAGSRGLPARNFGDRNSRPSGTSPTPAGIAIRDAPAAHGGARPRNAFVSGLSRPERRSARTRSYFARSSSARIPQEVALNPLKTVGRRGLSRTYILELHECFVFLGAKALRSLQLWTKKFL